MGSTSPSKLLDEVAAFPGVFLTAFFAAPIRPSGPFTRLDSHAQRSGRPEKDATSTLRGMELSGSRLNWPALVLIPFRGSASPAHTSAFSSLGAPYLLEQVLEAPWGGSGGGHGALDHPWDSLSLPLSFPLSPVLLIPL